MTNHETTTNEIMEFLQENMITKEDLKGELGQIRKEMRIMEHRIMDAMDDKLAGLKGDLVLLMRSLNGKLCELVKILGKRRVIAQKDVGEVLEMQPFPQIK